MSANSDPSGRATRTSYNAASQPTQVERWFTANVGDAACVLTDARPEGINTNIWRKYEYNAAGLQSAEIDANGNRTQMTYEGLGRLIVTTFADSAEAWSINDQRGQVVISKTRGGDYRDVGFDQIGRINHVWENHETERVWMKGRNTRTGYDLAGRPVWKDVSTQPNPQWDEALRRDVHIYGYDAAGRATVDQLQPMDAAIGSATRTLTYGYDAAGNRTSIAWPDGFTATYAFDAANRPQTVNFGGHTATIAHDSLGRRTGVTRSSGANSAYAYEADGDLLSLTHNWSAGSGQAAASWTYGHDAVGRITSTDVTRLELEWLPTPAYARAYGPANNLNQVASQAGQALVFNANGNLSTFQGATYTWALGNRLVGVSRPGMTASYAYDGEDRRTMKVVDGVTTRTLWSGADEVAEMDGAGNILRRFIPDGSGAMDGRLASLEASGTIYWHHTDHQGSVVATSNASGAPVSLVNYSPNGELGTAADGASLTAPPTGSPFGYTGRQYDSETGLWQYRARYYHPQLGQFVSTDPIGTKDDPNLYLYVGQDPVNRVDPTGLAGRGNLSKPDWDVVKKQQSEALSAVRAARSELSGYLADPESNPDFAERFASYGGDVANMDHIRAYAGRLAFTEVVLADDGSNYNYQRGGGSTTLAATVKGQDTIVLNDGFFAAGFAQKSALIHEPQHFRNSAGYMRNPPVDDQDIGAWVGYSNGNSRWSSVQAVGSAQAQELARQRPRTAIYNPENVAQMVLGLGG